MLNDVIQVGNFVSSVEVILCKYGFDGIDIDFESGVGVMLGVVVQVNFVIVVKQFKVCIGSSFYLLMVFEYFYVQGGYVVYGGIWGVYLFIIDGLCDELIVLYVQYYNNGVVYMFYLMNGFVEGSVDMLVVVSCMLIEGFMMNNGSGFYVF